MSISCYRESISCYREFFFASCDSQPTSSWTDGRRALRRATAWGGDWRFGPAGAFGRTECISAIRLMRLRRMPLRGRSLWMSSGVHISGNQAVECQSVQTAGARRFSRPHARSEGSSPTHQCALGGWGLVRRAVRFPNAILVDAVGAWMSGGGGGGAMDGRLTGRTPAAAWSRCAPSWRRSVRRGTMWACSSSSVNPKHRFLQGKIAPVDWGASGKGDAP